MVVVCERVTFNCWRTLTGVQSRARMHLEILRSVQITHSRECYTCPLREVAGLPRLRTTCDSVLLLEAHTARQRFAKAVPPVIKTGAARHLAPIGCPAHFAAFSRVKLLTDRRLTPPRRDEARHLAACHDSSGVLSTPDALRRARRRLRVKVVTVSSLYRKKFFIHLSIG